MSYPRPEKPLSEESLSDALTYFLTIYEPEEMKPMYFLVYPHTVALARHVLRTARRKARNAAGRWLVQRIKRVV